MSSAAVALARTAHRRANTPCLVSGSLPHHLQRHAIQIITNQHVTTEKTPFPSTPFYPGFPPTREDRASSVNVPWGLEGPQNRLTLEQVC